MEQHSIKPSSVLNYPTSSYLVLERSQTQKANLVGFRFRQVLEQVKHIHRDRITGSWEQAQR